MKITTLNRKEIVTIFLGSLILTSLLAWVSATPPRTEQFASVSVLGSRMTVANYFPNNVATVTLNEQIGWNLQVYNHMGTSQLFLLKVILANTTITGPDAARNIPTQGSLLMQSFRVVLNNETWSLPLQWSITGETNAGGSTTIQTMMVNNNPVNGGISAVNGKSFRIVLELWSYDTQEHNVIFSFEVSGVLNSIFNQVWFNTG
jgi:uncharacterized membrane protein